MDYSSDMQIIELDSFTTAFPVRPGAEDEARRRYMTLLGEMGTHAKVGGTSYVSRAWTLAGEPLALKRLLAGAAVPESAEISSEDAARITQGHAAAFHEEYLNQLRVSNLRGFPRLYGYGTTGGDPVIVMEWVEGVSLRRLAHDMAAEGETPSARMVASLGASILEVLESMGRLDATLVHRDISPANILVRTESTPLTEQVDSGNFDICLIDFGSASADAESADASFTMVTNLWRNGTPEYAPPEMLTKDVPHVDDLRKSQKIDVFALCSVLYELYAGRTPWRVAEHPDTSPYRLKTENPPAPLLPRCSDDDELVAVIMQGLAIRQQERPGVCELQRAMRRFLGGSDWEEYAGEGGPATPRATQKGMPSDSPISNVLQSDSPSAPQSAPVTTPGPTTPDSTHLRVAAGSEGGKRASDPVAPFEPRAGQPFSRRSLVIGGAMLVAATVVGAGASTILRTSTTEPRLSGYAVNENAVAEAIWQGEPLYPVRALEDNTWQLYRPPSASGNAEKARLDAQSRIPGLFVDGLVKVYDKTSGGYGFMTAVPEATGLATAWALSHTFLQAKDFCSSAAMRSGTFALASGEDSPDRQMQLAPVRDADSRLWGYIDATGADRIAAAYADARGFSRGHAAVRSAKNLLWGLVNADGKEVLAPAYCGLGTCSEESLVPAATESLVNWSFVHTNGERAFGGTWTAVQRFSEGLAGFFAGTAGDLLAGGVGSWGFLNTQGQIAIEPQFLDVCPFSGGLAPAQDAKTRFWGLIDTSGSWKVKPRYLRLGTRAADLFPAHGSPANIYDTQSAEWKAHAQAEGNSDFTFACGLVNTDGEWVAKPTFADTLIDTQRV